jgi:RNA polymerase sigma-70 factor, ECF subfamily
VGNPAVPASFHEQFVGLFHDHFPRLCRLMNRLSGERELAMDVVQEAFMQLYQRGAMPDAPESWLITVALNRFRNAKSTRSRRLRLLTPSRGEGVHGEPALSPEESQEREESRLAVRRVLDQMPERDRYLLLLQAEGYRYREIAAALAIKEASVGVFLMRAKRAFRELYEQATDAS